MAMLSTINGNFHPVGLHSAPFARTLVYATGLTILTAGELALMLEFSVWATAHLLHMPHVIALSGMILVLGPCVFGAFAMFTHTWRIEDRIAAGLDPHGVGWNPLKR